jgi:hypothetical protein
VIFDLSRFQNFQLLKQVENLRNIKNKTEQQTNGFYVLVMENKIVRKSFQIFDNSQPTPIKGVLHHTFADKMGPKTKSLPQIVVLL